MHRKHFLAIVLSTTVAVIFASGSVSEVGAQSKKKSSATKKSTSSKSRSTKAATGRLPIYFGQVDLKPEQREEVYKIQGSYKDKIEKLQKELDALKAKQMKEIEGVLTSTQKKKLASLRKAGSSSSTSRSKSKSKSKSKK